MAPKTEKGTSSVKKDTVKRENKPKQTNNKSKKEVKNVKTKNKSESESIPKLIPDVEYNNNSFNYETETWDVINYYFKQHNQKQLVNHQHQTYQQFLTPQLKEIIKQFNTVIIYDKFSGENNKHAVELHIDFEEYYLGKPLINENDGSYSTMKPIDARLRHMTYASPLSIDLKLKRILRTGPKLEKEDVQEMMLNKVNFGKIPIMVQGNNCILSERKDTNLQEEGECKYDLGGYFIISGNEKVIVSQEKIADNKVFVFNNQRQTKSIDANIKSVPDMRFSVAVNNIVQYVFKTKEVVVVTPNFRNPINILLLLHALGIESDQALISMIIWDTEDEKMRSIKDLLGPTLKKYKNIMSNHKLSSINDIRQYLLKQTNFKGINKEIKLSPDKKFEYLLRSLKIEVLPHLGESYKKKAYFLGYMAQKLFRVYLGYSSYDDRDSYTNKRIETPGILMASLFRQCFNRLVKDMKKSISREFTNNKSGKDVFDIININNIYKIIKPTFIEGGLKYALSTGNWSIKSGSSGNQKSKVGTAQVLNRLCYQSYLAHLRRVNSPSDKNNGKIVAPRKIHPSQWGYICPVETPEGAPVGLVKNMALTCEITVNYSSIPVREWLYDHGVIQIGSYPTEDALYNGKVFVNGDWLGIHYDSDILVDSFKKARRTGIISPYISINWGVQHGEIFIYTDYGRTTRPLYIIKNNRIKISKDNLSNVKKYGWNYLINPSISNIKEFPNSSNTDGKSNLVSNMVEGYIEYIDCEEQETVLIAMREKDLKMTRENLDMTEFVKQYTHCEIHPSLGLSVIGAVIPFPDHNQSPRNTYQSAMGKQSMGINPSNFQVRMDTLCYVMNNIERPIVGTKLANHIGFNTLPNGLNAIIAVASYTGYNQEDSLIINQHAVDRGLFRTTFYRTYKDEEKKNQSTGKEEKFAKPNSKYTKMMKPANYNKLDSRGFVEKDLYVDSKDVIIGKILPTKSKSNEDIKEKRPFQDHSTTLKMNEDGFVDKIYTNRNADGFKFVKIRTRCERIPQIGDKFSSRCGQKGTCGMTLPQEHMPFNGDGISPDAIMNPHAIPSRMTIGQVMECVLGKASVMLGGFSDCTPFTEVNTEKIGDVLENLGFERHGNETLYNGVTGQQMDCQIFMGPTFYQRLKHMVADKIHSRASGPVVQLTRQPAEGRSRDGGLRIGEMEKDCFTGDVLTSIGFSRTKTIKEIVENPKYNKVLTINPITFHPEITEIHSKFSKMSNDIYKLTTESGREVMCTGTHLHLINNTNDSNDSNNNQWKETKDLTDKDNIIIRNTIQSLSDSNGELPKGYPEVEELITLSRVIGLLESNNMKCDNPIDSVNLNNEIDAKELIIDIVDLGDKTPIIDISNINDNNINDNNINDNNINDNNINYSIKISDDLKFILDELEISNNRKSTIKRVIPKWLLKSSDSVKQAFLSGYCGGSLDCQMVVKSKGNKNTERIAINPIILKSSLDCLNDNIEYINQISKLFKDLGIDSEMYLKRQPNPCNQLIYLTISSSIKNLIRFVDVIDFSYSNNKRNQSSTMIEFLRCKINNSNKLISSLSFKEFNEKYYLENNKVVIPIKSIIKQDKPEEVYDFTTVSSNHSFIANSIVTHNCMIAHGAVSFLKERMMDVSDPFTAYVCRLCGLFAQVDPKNEIFRCGGCKNSSDFSLVGIPYACKLLFQELMGMSITPRLRFNNVMGE